MANTFVFDDEPPQTPDPEPPAPEPSEPKNPEGGEGSNRAFLITAIILGGIVLLSLVCMAVYALLFLPAQKASAQATDAANSAANTQVVLEQQQTQEASAATATLPPTEVSAPEPTETLVVFFASATPSPAITIDPSTATVEALQTLLAVSQSTATSTEAAKTATPAKSSTPGTAGTPGTPGALNTPVGSKLARTGFADEFGLPGLFAAAVLIITIIVLARRLRQASTGR